MSGSNEQDKSGPASDAVTPDGAHHGHPGTSVPQVEQTSDVAMPPASAENAAQEPVSTSPQIDRRLLELLVCPLTKQPLDYDAKAQELISVAARLAFPIRDGIPIMLPEEARQLMDEPGR